MEGFLFWGSDRGNFGPDCEICNYTWRVFHLGVGSRTVSDRSDPDIEGVHGNIRQLVFDFSEKLAEFIKVAIATEVNKIGRRRCDR